VPVRSPVLNVMANAALKAARGLIRDFGEVEQLQVSVKGPGEFVSTADLKAERTLRQELSRARPGYGLLFEEGGAAEGSDPHHRWIVDPLDGTTNFLHALPIFAISIGLEREGQLVAGVIFNPATDEMYVAEKGQGAWLNNRRLRVASRRDFAEALVGCGIPPLSRAHIHPRFKTELAAVLARCGNIRRLGAASLDLAMVASGRLDCYWERGLSAWDMAAGIVIVREAGGYASDADGGERMLETGSICVGNESMHRSLLATLRSA
jgi:myo-inositol-1(or 4)-monophosphatase